MVADPKALQYILQTSGYRFPKRADARASARMVIGDGIVYVHGTSSCFFIHIEYSIEHRRATPQA
jgi:hypothetical protein